MQSLVGLVAVAACATSFHAPMTAAELVRAHDASALIVYLGQPSADPAVCDAAAAGPHIVVDDAVDRTLVDALRDGKIPPPIWRACADRILASGDRAGRAHLLDEILRSYPQLLAAPAIEHDPAVQARLAALEGAYEARAPEIIAHPDVAAALAVDLYQQVSGPALGAFARRSANEMATTLSLERGSWGDRVIDVGLLDQLAAQHNEAALARIAARLPDAALRSEARRRVIRLRIAASPYPEVREDAAHVEAVMMELGNNPVSPRLQPPTASLPPACRSSAST
jgi:hypothetical protein